MTLLVGTDSYISLEDADSYHEKYGNTAWTVYRKEISAITEHADGVLLTTKTAHGAAAFDGVVLEGTLNYDGSFTALTVVDTLNVSANATYVLDETTGYFKLLIDCTEREVAIRLATQWIDLTHGTSFRGAVRDTTQNLLFPREGIYDDKGEDIDPDTIPYLIEAATAELALMILNDTDIYINTSSEDSLQKIQETIGPIVTKWRVNEDKVGRQPMFFKVERLLDCLVYPSAAGNVNIERA